MQQSKQQSAPQPVESGGTLSDFLQKNLVLVISAGCVVLALVFFSVYRITRASQASDSISDAWVSPKSVADLQNVTEKYPDTPTAPLALLKLGKICYDGGSYELAGKQYEQFLQKYPDHIMVPDAELGRIHCIEALGQYQFAADQFGAFCVKYKGHYLVPQAILGEARCLELMNKYREARALYEDYITGNLKSDWIPRFKEVLNAVTKKIEAEDAEQAKANVNTNSRPVSL